MVAQGAARLTAVLPSERIRNGLVLAGKHGRRVVADCLSARTAQCPPAMTPGSSIGTQAQVMKLAALVGKAKAESRFLELTKESIVSRAGNRRPRSAASMRGNGLTARSRAASTSLVSSPTKTPSPAWSARSLSGSTIMGRTARPILYMTSQPALALTAESACKVHRSSRDRGRPKDVPFF